MVRKTYMPEQVIKALAKDIGIPLHLRDLGVRREASVTNSSGKNERHLLANNPKPITLDNIR